MAAKSLDSKRMAESGDGFDEAYEANVNSIYKFLFWRTRDAQLSQDLTSTTFEKAWTARASFKGGSVAAWLHRIARNVLIDYWRKHKELAVEDVELLQTETADSPAELLDKQIALDQLAAALNKLPQQMQQVVNMRFINNLSVKQVAARLELSESNVRVIQYRALQKLREFLK